MTSLYEVLKRSKTAPQLAPDMFTALWAKSITAGETIELSGQVPLSFKANGNPLLDFLISGNTVQSGTPTQDNPITPSECGDLIKIKISEPLCGIDTYKDELNLATGACTRKIKKLVLTGEELWNMYQNTYYITVSGYYRLHDVGHHLSVCSHFPIKQEVTLPEMCYGLGGLIDEKAYTAWNGNIVFNPSPMISSLADWKSYLAAQYAAGTPVTIWYVLEVPTTGIANEPIRKIGDYADTLSMEQAGVQIPTNNGSTTLDVLTTVKPSNVSIKYRV